MSGWQKLDDWMLATYRAAGEGACDAKMKQSANAANTSVFCLSRRKATNLLQVSHQMLDVADGFIIIWIFVKFGIQFLVI